MSSATNLAALNMCIRARLCATCVGGSRPKSPVAFHTRCYCTGLSCKAELPPGHRSTLLAWRQFGFAAFACEYLMTFKIQNRLLCCFNKDVVQNENDLCGVSQAS